VSRLPQKSVPLLVRAMFSGRRHRSSSHRRSTFHFPFVLSCLPTHLVSIPSYTCCVFNPLPPPPISLSGIVYCKCLCMLCLVCVGLCTHLLIVLFSSGVLLLNCAVENTVFALLRLTSLPPVRTPYRIPDQTYGVSRSRYPRYRGGGARPGACSNAPPSWHCHGPCCPDILLPAPPPAQPGSPLRAPPSGPSGIRLSLPQKYNGTAANCQGFLLQLDLYLATVHPAPLGNERLSTLISCLTGKPWSGPTQCEEREMRRWTSLRSLNAFSI
jgi:hypothetical protein